MKYKVKLTVEYDFDVEDLVGITEEDIEGYKSGFQDSYFDNSEEIEDVKGLIIAELENAIYGNIPISTPHTSKALKINPDMEVVEYEFETV